MICWNEFWSVPEFLRKAKHVFRLLPFGGNTFQNLAFAWFSETQKKQKIIRWSYTKFWFNYILSTTWVYSVIRNWRNHDIFVWITNSFLSVIASPTLKTTFFICWLYKNIYIMGACNISNKKWRFISILLLPLNQSMDFSYLFKLC